MDTKKVTVNLPERQIKFLQALAAKEHITFTDALRRSIRSEEFFTEQENKGLKVLVEDKDKKLRQIERR